jgi:hypothetical protein
MDTRPHTRIALALAAPLYLIATLSVAEATASSTAMDACIRAFISTAVPKDRQVRLHTESLAATMISRGRPYSITLAATSSSSGKQLAAANCRIDRHGNIALNGKPITSLTAPDAKAGPATEGK